MDLIFANGTALQERVVREAVAGLLHLDTDTAYPFPWTISFVPNPVSDPHVHHPFAITNLDAGQPSTEFRDDFPHFSESGFGSMAFAHETVIHELGHAAEANLTTEVQEQVAALFGTDQADLYPTEKAWEDRPGEGMAETFKDAFLPQSLRAYANRTRVKLPITKYPELRRLFRTGAAEGEPGSGTSINPLDLAVFEQNDDLVYPLGFPASQDAVNSWSFPNGALGYYDNPDTDGVFDVVGDTQVDSFAPLDPSLVAWDAFAFGDHARVYGTALLDATVKDGTVLEVVVPVGDWNFPTGSYRCYVGEQNVGPSVHVAAYSSLRYAAFPYVGTAPVVDATWAPVIGDEAGVPPWWATAIDGAWVLAGDAVAQGAPPLDFLHEITVDTEWPEIAECGGDVYRHVKIEFLLMADFALQPCGTVEGLPTIDAGVATLTDPAPSCHTFGAPQEGGNYEMTSDQMRQLAEQHLYPSIPTLQLTQAACSPAPAYPAGTLQTPPEGSSQGGDSASGQRKHPRIPAGRRVQT